MPDFVNPPATVDVPAERVTRIVSAAAPPQLVWECLTEPVLLARWLGDIAAFPEGITPGASGRFAWTGEVVLAARIDEVEPQSRLVFSWAEGVFSDRASKVELTLTGNERESQLHLVEYGFTLEGDETAKRESLRSLAAGWTVELDQLVELAEQLSGSSH